jgi:DDE_Tnp_1-associated/Transposase DDE domain
MSRSEILEQFSECWEGLDDPRSGNAVVHDFYELLLIALCAVLCGGQGAVDMALFARAKEPFLRSFLKMENGPPSHDTFSRLFRSLDPQQFGASFRRFMEKFSKGCQGVVAIDGKVLRRSFDRASGKSALHMVSAWGCEQRMVLAQIATDAKSNEITAVPKLLEMLALKGSIVTADALLTVQDFELALADFIEVDQSERIPFEQRFDDRRLFLATAVGVDEVALVLRLNGERSAQPEQPFALELVVHKSGADVVDGAVGSQRSIHFFLPLARWVRRRIKIRLYC